jgi:hypothetical protein
VKSAFAAFGKLERPVQFFFLLGYAWFLFLQLRSYGFTVDDSYISFRYAENLASGFGPVFNPGERTEGSSSFLWVLILAVARLLGANLVHASKLLGAILVLLIPWMLLSLSIHLPPKRPNIIGSWLAVLSPPLALWSVVGMETGAYTFLLTWAIYAAAKDLSEGATGRISACVPLLGAALMRPEGIALSAPYLAILLWRGLQPAFRFPLHRALSAAAIVFGGFLALTLFRLWFYGDLVPNTYYAKVTNPTLFSMGRPGPYLLSFLKGTSTWMWVGAALLPCLVRPVSAITAMAAGMVVMQLGFIGWFGADWMIGWRFVVPVFPALCLLAGSGIDLLCKRFIERKNSPAPARKWFVAATAMAITALASINSFAALEKNRLAYTITIPQLETPLIDWLERNAPPETTIAMGDCGAVPFYSGLVTIDMLGLNDAYVARHSPAENARYVVHERKPDLIVISGRGSGRGSLRSGFWLDGEILNLDDFWQRYEKVKTWKSSWSYDYHLFAIKGFRYRQALDFPDKDHNAK